ncbi:MAG: ferritin-like domain-containing protein, partial [Chitinophagaceae bacterium]
MNVKHILNEIEKADPEVYDRLDTRRNAMKQFTGMAGKLALAAVPIALGGMFKKAYGQSSSTLFN